MDLLLRVLESFFRRGAELRSTSLSCDGRTKNPYLYLHDSFPFVKRMMR